MKYLIAGLGNIGEEYAHTRHNIGFDILDAWAKSVEVKFRTDRLADVAECRFKGRTFVLIKPSTYMNLSGKAVNYWLQAEKIPVENLVVILDDVALPLGSIRLKGQGGDGGHNGLTSIQETLGTTNYARLRFGVGNNYPKGAQVDYVLGKWSKEEWNALPPRMALAIDAIKAFGTIGISLAMTNYNNK
ncbi:MAG: peptidyl-tRNA hydrolase [Bacteroidetes bacterium]|nr:MAG: peptidyl-tRNA hydrolase [Bacteroidota bacterium]